MQALITILAYVFIIPEIKLFTVCFHKLTLEQNYLPSILIGLLFRDICGCKFKLDALDVLPTE